MLRLPPLNAIKAFEATARHLSFTKAARELCVTQSAVSRHVQALENELARATRFRWRKTGRASHYAPTVSTASIHPARACLPYSTTFLACLPVFRRLRLA